MEESIHRIFEKFYRDPNRDTLSELLSENRGEFDLYDSKEKWPDWQKTARHILGFSNYRGGAIIIVISKMRIILLL
jgi:hypothetical protein